jgi:hypothetical protein
MPDRGTGINREEGYMEQVKKLSYSSAKPTKRHIENVLTPVSLVGVIVPWSKKFIGGRASDYKLVCPKGLEYFIIRNSEWKEALSWCSWEEVQIAGLLNIAEMTIILQKIFPKGPIEKNENVIDMNKWMNRKFLKKMLKTVNELVLVPAAICAMMT